jgi:hypothetical protein
MLSLTNSQSRIYGTPASDFESSQTTRQESDDNYDLTVPYLKSLTIWGLCTPSYLAIPTTEPGWRRALQGVRGRNVSESGE